MLIGQHIFLRNLQLTDADVMLKWENSTENWQVSGTTRFYTKAEITTFVNTEPNIELNKQLRLIICLNKSKIPIGTLDLFELDAAKKSVGVGVLIAEIKHRNNGFATETLNLIIDYCKNELKLVYLFCNIQNNNATSICLFEKCGFQFVQKKKLFEKPVNYYELKLC